VVASAGGNAVAYIEPIDNGVYIKEENSIPLALNVLGFDRPSFERVPEGSFVVGEMTAKLAASEVGRNQQVQLAVALLMAVDVYDRQAAWQIEAQKRRDSAAAILSKDVANLGAWVSTGGSFGNEQIGKLREALGRYDAALAN